MVDSKEQKEQKYLIDALKRDNKVTHKEAVEILIRLHIAFKVAKIYEPNNVLFLGQVKKLFTLIQNTLKNEEEALFSLRQDSIFFNTIHLRFSFSNYHVFKFMINELKKKQIGSLRFEPNLSEEELRKFVTLFTKGFAKTEVPIEEFLDEVKKSGIQHISFEKISPLELASGKGELTTKIYFLSIFHLRELFERQEHGEKVNLNTARRLIQSLFNHIVRNESFVLGLTNIKNYHEYTLNHSINVCVLSIALGRRLGLARNELVDLGISAFFHDIGKLDTPLQILDKPGGLSDEEREVIQKHPYRGAQKLVHIAGFKKVPLRAINVSLEHHARANLSGYPRYFKKRSLSFFSKIANITDYFDAITTKRVYRKKTFTRQEALKLMLEKSGTEFDPLILKVFANMMGVYPIGSLVSLDTGELGIVLETNPDPAFMVRPKVKLITDKSGNKIEGEVVDLTEMLPETKKYKRSIVKALDPNKYDIQVSDYFLALAG